MDEELRQLIHDLKTYIQATIDTGISQIYTSHNKTSQLDELSSKIKKCHLCNLYRTRKNAVPGEGASCADLVFIGEAPGFEEDKLGRPFVGKAGMLLTKIIHAMGLKREEVFICNLIKCRPPNNRNPLPYEIATCKNYLDRQLELIQPKVICTLGKFSSQYILNTQKPISDVRGKWAEYKGIKIMPTFHPAYLLRNPKDKRLVWEDMKKIKKHLGI